MAKKQNSLIKSIGDVFRRLSITVNLTVYTIYLIYLIYSIAAGVGLLYVNIALAILTAAFMGVYLVLRLSNREGKSKEIKAAKRYYKRFKMLARAVSSITAVYALLTAIEAVSPIALIVAFLGAVFTVIRLVVELISYFIQKKLMKIKENIVSRFKPREADAAEIEAAAEEAPVKVKRRKKKDDDPDFLGDLEEKILPVDDCVLSEMESI